MSTHNGAARRPEETDVKASGLKKVVAASMAGTVVEWYEFFLYASAATLVFGKAFFPNSQTELDGILAAFLTYAVGFVARPIGGIVFGHFGDKFGRKQLLQLGAIDFCQVDSCRLASVNEIVPVLLMAAKFGVPVCPHAGGVGLCEYVQHLAIVDYLCISGSLDDRMLEYVSHLHEHFVYPVEVTGGAYRVPHAPGYSIEMHQESLDTYRFPDGSYWRRS